MGTRTLSLCQYGLESTHGTAVPADTKLAMWATMPESDREIHIPQVVQGVRTPGLLDSAHTRRLLAEFSLEDQDGAYFEVFPLLFSALIDGNISAAEQNGGEGDYKWDFTDKQTGAEDVDSFTLEMADDTDAYEVAYCLIKSVNITGDCSSGEVHVSAEVFGDEFVQTTVTGSLSLPTTVELCNAKLARLYVDSSWANLGNTELVGLRTFDITLNGGVHPKHYGAANRKFDSHGQNEVGGTASFVLERTSSVATEELNFRPASGHAVTSRFIRLTITGDQIGAGDNQTLQIDLAGVWTAWQPISAEIDGNNVDAPTLTLGYDATGAHALALSVTTTINAI